MTVSSNPNYKSCWLCDNDVHITGGTFCSEFDTYCCISHIKDLHTTCPVCECEGVKTSHTIQYQPQNGYYGNGA